MNISSHQALHPGFGVSNYAASKAALIGLTRSAAVELGPSNITVNAVQGNVPPTVSITTPADAQSFPNGSDIYVVATASDSDGSVVSVDLYLDGQFVRQEGLAPYEWNGGGGQDEEGTSHHGLAARSGRVARVRVP